jgi:hypothetical protein
MTLPRSVIIRSVSSNDALRRHNTPQKGIMPHNVQVANLLTNLLLTRVSPLLNEVRRAMRMRHMSRRTEASYLYYIVAFISFHGKRDLRELGVGEIRAGTRLERR